MFRSYINPKENAEANSQMRRLLFEGLLLGGTGLGVLALIFEIAADAFSVAAYQTLLAIHGAEGNHDVAIAAFVVLSVLLLLGIVPAYKAGAYLRPNAGGSGPLVEAIGPEKMRWLSWIGTSLFFVDAVLTIIISSISASDVTMLILPELAAYRIYLAEFYAFFIMAVLVSLGPKRAVPVFLIGGGAFTIFTIIALGFVGGAALANPEWSALTEAIVSRLELTGVAEHVVRVQESAGTLGLWGVSKLFFASMSSAMLGFSGYEVIPASGKHAARPKWKVINTALTIAAVFLIGTGVVQLTAAKQWDIPATEGYSTLLIEYEIVAAQMFGRGVDVDQVEIMPEDEALADELMALHHGEDSADSEHLAENFAVARMIEESTDGRFGASFLTLSGILLAIILLLAQGGGYVGGAAVAANAARLGRLPNLFANDRNGIAVIWLISAIFIPLIREVVVVEAYYAFGFVSAFAITSTTVYFVREDALRDRGIEPGSAEARSLRFAGLRGMIASYIMGIVLIATKTDALVAIIIAGAIITTFQLYISSGKLARPQPLSKLPTFAPGTQYLKFDMGIERAHDQARQRGMVHAVEDLIESGTLAKFNVGPQRIRTLVSYLYNLDESLFIHSDHQGHGRIEEPNLALEATYQSAYAQKEQIADDIEAYSHFGIFTFIKNYHLNWVSPENGRTAEDVQSAMVDILFPLTHHEEVWPEYCAYQPTYQPEPIWQFSRMRYLWAKDQWPNLSDRITTVWTLQDFGLLERGIDIQTVISVAGGKQFMKVNIHTTGEGQTSSDTTPLESA